MFEAMNKMMLAGLGVMSMSREKAESIFDEYVSRGQAEREGKSSFVKELMDSADKTRQDLEKLVNEQMHKAIESTSVATKNDISRIEQQLQAITATLEKLQQDD